MAVTFSGERHRIPDQIAWNRSQNFGPSLSWFGSIILGPGPGPGWDRFQNRVPDLFLRSFLTPPVNHV